MLVLVALSWAPPVQAQTPASDEQLQLLLDELGDIRAEIEDVGLAVTDNQASVYDAMIFCFFSFAFIYGLDALLPRPR